MGLKGGRAGGGVAFRPGSPDEESNTERGRARELKSKRQRARRVCHRMPQQRSEFDQVEKYFLD